MSSIGCTETVFNSLTWLGAAISGFLMSLTQQTRRGAGGCNSCNTWLGLHGVEGSHPLAQATHRKRTAQCQHESWDSSGV